MTNYVRERATEILERQDLPNVTDTAFALNPEFTASYGVLALELQATAGYQLRVTGTMFSLALLGLNPSQADIDAATKKALRTLMKGMHDQARAWLDANPEETT